MDYLDGSQLAELVGRLGGITAADKLNWKMVNNDTFRFSASSGDFGFVIKSKDSDDYHPYIFSVHKRTEGSASAKLQEVSTEDGRLEAELSALYGLVKRKVLDLDSIANQLFEELKKLEP